MMLLIGAAIGTGVTAWYRSRKDEDGLFQDFLDFARCFPGSARILTPSGYHPIASLSTGDTVVAQLSASGAARVTTVTRFLQHPPATIWQIITDELPGAIETTRNHTFLTLRGMIATRNLRPGDGLLTAGVDLTRTSARVRDVRATLRREPVYNIFTAPYDTFIVEGVVAHNFSYFRRSRAWLHRLLLDPVSASRNPPRPMAS